MQNLFESTSSLGRCWDSRIDVSTVSPTVVPVAEVKYDAQEDGVSLLLFGDEQSLLCGVDLEFGDKPVWIHGLTQDGRRWTVADAVITEWKDGDSKLRSTRKFVGRAFLDGIHVSEESRYKSAGFEYPGLLEFLTYKQRLDCKMHADSSVDVHSLGTDDLIDTQITFKKVAASIKFRLTPTLSENGTSQELVTRATIVIAPDTPQPDVWFIEVSYQIAFFLTFLYGIPTMPTAVTLLLSSSSPVPETVSVWYQMWRRGIDTSPSWAKMFITCRSAGPSPIQTALQSWFELSDEWLNIAQTFIGAYLFQHPTSRMGILIFAQILEVMDALDDDKTVSLTNSEAMQLNSFKQHGRQNMDSDLWERVAKCLSFLGKPSQRQRLQKLFLSLNEYIPSLFYDDPIPFVTCVVDTRNYYVHGTFPRKNTFLDGAEKHCATEGLKLAIIFLFLKKLSFTAKQLGYSLQLADIARQWSSARNSILRDEILKKRLNEKFVLSN